MPEKGPARSTIVTGMTYRNAPAAIEWLCGVFGFEKHAVYPGPDNTIMHAELTLGGGMIMLGSLQEDEYSPLMRHPDEIGGAETRSANLIVEDADAVYTRATDAGAAILFEIEDKPYGGRGFTCRDPEGHIWNVGTYDPWRPKVQVVAGIIERENRVLICRRTPEQSHALKWEFPGGKIERGESPAQALERELEEELGIRRATSEEITRYEFAYPGKRPILLIFLRVHEFAGEPRNLIFHEIRWEPAGNLGGFDFLEGDRDFLRAYYTGSYGNCSQNGGSRPE